MLYIHHSEIASYNFIPRLSSFASPPIAFYYNLTALLYPSVIVHSFHMTKPPKSTHLYAVSSCLPTPSHFLSHQKSFFPSMSPYTSTVLSSCHFSPALPTTLLSLPTSHYHKDQKLLTHAWKSLPFMCSENTLEISTSKGSLNFFQPHLILATMISSKTTTCINQKVNRANALPAKLVAP